MIHTFKHFISKLPAPILERGINLYYQSRTFERINIEKEFIKTMDELIRVLEGNDK